MACKEKLILLLEFQEPDLIFTTFLIIDEKRTRKYGTDSNRSDFAEGDFAPNSRRAIRSSGRLFNDPPPPRPEPHLVVLDGIFVVRAKQSTSMIAGIQGNKQMFTLAFGVFCDSPLSRFGTFLPACHVVRPFPVVPIFPGREGRSTRLINEIHSRRPTKLKR